MFFLGIFFWKKINGLQKIVIDIKLNEYAPIKDRICIVSIDHCQVYEIKFQGKPDNTFPLINSKKEKIKEKNIIKKIFLSTNGPVNKIENPKKRDKNNGIKISEIKIKFLKVSSWVKEIEIQ